MPILSEEPNLFPDSLFAGNERLTQGRHWWVLHTKPRQEKGLARQLINAQVPFYLPLTKQRNLIRGRILESQLPLFPGYVFLLGQAEDRIKALATHRVVRSLPVNDQDLLWHDLSQVSRLLAAGLPVTPEEKLGPGSPVEIRSGPLKGLRGKILRVASGKRFIVTVDFIHRGASVLLDDYNLAPATEPATI